MITPAHIENFESIASALRKNATLSTRQEIAAIKNASSSGSSSTRTALLIDSKVASSLAAWAQKLFEAQKDLSPHAETDTDCTTLQRTLQHEIQLLGTALVALSVSEAGAIMTGLGNTWSPTESSTSLTNALSEFPSKIYLAALAHVRSSQMKSSSSTTINVNAPNVVFQHGDNNIANVQQQLSQSYTPQQVVEALDSLSAALGKHQTVATQQAIEALEHVRAEVNKVEPNRITVKGIIGGIKDLVETLKAAPDAWNLIQGWISSMST